MTWATMACTPASLDGGDHGVGLLERERHRLLAQDVLAGHGGGDHAVGVQVGGQADVDHVDLRIGQEGSPVVIRARPVL